MKLSLCLVVLGLAAATPARAEFLFAPSGSASAGPAAGSYSGPAHVAVPPRRRAPSLPAVQGFGDAVPLHVAARQIVPEGTSIVFGDGVDRELPIDWQGGRPWNLVLADAIKPLGFKLTRAGSQVSITR